MKPPVLTSTEVRPLDSSTSRAASSGRSCRQAVYAPSLSAMMRCLSFRRGSCHSGVVVLSHVPPDLLQVVHAGLAGAFLPGEDAHGGDAVEFHLGQGPEEQVP